VLSFEDVLITGCLAWQHGGGVALEGRAALIVSSSSFKSNSAMEEGGGVWGTASSINLSQAVFQGNYAKVFFSWFLVSRQVDRCLVYCLGPSRKVCVCAWRNFHGGQDYAWACGLLRTWLRFSK
jgi:hypothetical protein